MSPPLHAFHGGVPLVRHKEATNTQPSRTLSLPAQLVYPLRAHIGTPARPVVRVGQRVLRGEAIAAPDSYVSQAIHAATSGVIAAIGPRPVIHSAGLTDTCIVLEADGEHRAIDPWPALHVNVASPGMLLARIVDAGIIGMGGAGFPSHVKLREGTTRAVKLLIINGVECEPYISCDDCVLRERPAQVVSGARALLRALRAERCIIAVEEDMVDAVAALAPHVGEDVELVTVPALYPAGGEKQLIKLLTGSEISTHSLPIQAGIVMHNVATALAVYEAVAPGLPLTERMVTVTGAVREPANLRVPLGTPLAHLLDSCGRTDAAAPVIVGGPMMGTAIVDAAAPVVKTTNCVLVLPQAEPAAPVMPCIRCGECIEVCPAQLQPQALYEFARGGDWDSAQAYHLFDCIECGACAYACPSRIPLVHYYRHVKAEIDALDAAQQQAEELRARHQSRQARLAQAGTEAPSVEPEMAATATIEAQHSIPETRAAMQAEIAAAVARAQARRQRARATDDNDDSSADGSGDRH